MTTYDWVTDITLIALVLLQLRRRRLGLIQLLLPIVLVALAVWHYFAAWPGTFNGALLVGGASAVGALLGVGSGICTRVWTVDEVVFVRAGAVAAVLWIVGMGFRLGFQLWAHSASGAARVVTLSMQHDLDRAAWVDALLFMAIAQVLVRAFVLVVRRLLLARSSVLAHSSAA